MIISSEHAFDETRTKKYQLCIIGSGPAGMTIANELKGSGVRYCVLESGGFRKQPRADKLRHTESTGIFIKEYSRERIVGGTSTTWAGLSSPLDPIDFISRKDGTSTWPLSYATLSHYYKQTVRYDFPAAEAFTTKALATIRTRGDLRQHWRSLSEKVFLAKYPPQNFGRYSKDIFLHSENADLYLDATVVELCGEPHTTRITRARFRTALGEEGFVTADIFILATGGIENARLLLVSKDLCVEGIGNDYDQVGRYLMNHPKNYYGAITLERPVQELPYFFGYMLDGYAGYAGLRLNEDIQKEQGVLNAYVRFEPLFPWSDNEGVEAFLAVIKRAKLLMKSWFRFQRDNIIPLRNYAETGDDSEIQNQEKTKLDWVVLTYRMLQNLFPIAQYTYARLKRNKKPLVKTMRLRNFLEMEARAENRITLSEKKDAYGSPLPVVHHECSALDRRSIITLHAFLRRELIELSIGKLEGDLATEHEWPINLDSSHHMGTTRMGTDPKNSVLDVNCKVHGIANLYVAGSSVFPTSGCANPTMTIVALSIRLADHLKQLFSSNQ